MAAVNEVVEQAKGEPPWRDFAHTGPGTLAGRYMRTFWHPVYRAADLPPGRAVPIRIMSEDLTLYRGKALTRGEGGKPHLLAFRCAHRGTQLSAGWVEGDDLRCFYHGWKYDGAGQCIEQPAEPEPFCQKVRIRGYPTQEYLGLIFAYLGEGEPPPLPRYPEFERDDEIREAIIYVSWPCNFFNRIENASDSVHVTYTHFQLGQQIPRMESRETEYGLETRSYYPSGLVEVDHFHMPNLSQFQIGVRSPEETSGRDRLAWRMPIDDGHHMSFIVTQIHVSGEAAERYRERQRLRPQPDETIVPELGEAVLAKKLRIQDMLEHPNVVQVEDYVTLVGQGVIPDRQQDHLGHSDVGVILVRKIWERELAKLARGRPLKQWTRPERLEGRG